MYYCFKTINHTLHTQYNTNYIKTTTTSSTTITLNNMALNMHDDNINPLRPPRNNEGDPVKLLFQESMVKEKFGIQINNLPKKLLVKRNTAIYATIAEAIFCIVSIPLGAVGRGLSRASLYINIVTLGMAIIGCWACIHLKGPWVQAHYLTTFSLTGLFVLYCIIIAAVTGSDNILILLVLVIFMISDVVAGVYTYLFMREYNQFKKDIVAGKYNDVRRGSEAVANNNNNNNNNNYNNNPAATPPVTSSSFNNSTAVAPIMSEDDVIKRRMTYPNCPDLYKCPITTDIMFDPVTAEDGYTYEREAILEWFVNNSTSPMTNVKIGKNIIPNHAIKSAAMEYMDKIDRDNKTEEMV